MADVGASPDHGGRERIRSLRPDPGRRVTSPPASPARGPARRWRDPRLAVGLRWWRSRSSWAPGCSSAADDTVAGARRAATLAAGQRLDRRRPDRGPAAVRLRGGRRPLPGRRRELPDGAVLLRPVGAGELVPRAGPHHCDSGGLVELPLAVDPGRVPAGVRPGAVVDVWVTGDRDGGGRTERPLVPRCRSSPSPAPAASAPTGMRQVVVGIDTGDESSLHDVVGRLHGSLLVVRRPG